MAIEAIRLILKIEDVLRRRCRGFGQGWICQKSHQTKRQNARDSWDFYTICVFFHKVSPSVQKLYRCSDAPTDSDSLRSYYIKMRRTVKCYKKFANPVLQKAHLLTTSGLMICRQSG
jgi:hypothetical protein